MVASARPAWTSTPPMARTRREIRPGRRRRRRQLASGRQLTLLSINFAAQTGRDRFRGVEKDKRLATPADYRNGKMHRKMHREMWSSSLARIRAGRPTYCRAAAEDKKEQRLFCLHASGGASPSLCSWPSLSLPPRSPLRVLHQGREHVRASSGPAPEPVFIEVGVFNTQTLKSESVCLVFPSFISLLPSSSDPNRGLSPSVRLCRRTQETPSARSNGQRRLELRQDHRRH